MSELEFGQAPLHKLSPRRKSTQINVAMLALIVVTVLIPVYGHHSTRNIRDALLEEVDETAPAAVSAQSTTAAMEALAQARTRWLSLGIAAAVLITFVAVRMIHLGMKTVAMEIWIRRLGAGDLEYTVPVTGRDEIAEVGLALEKLRQSSIKAMQLDLVKKLSEGLEKKNEELERVLEELRRSQEQIVARQKLVELGELTAGVAHEIRNPLNFMKNFAVASEDLIEELDDVRDRLKGEHRELFTELSRNLADNMQRIRTNGERVDRIVNDMIKIGRGGGRTQHVDITELLTKQAQLAYQSHRAQDRSFAMEIRMEFDPDVGAVPMVPEDMARVFTNIVGNACFATAEKARQREAAGDDAYMPKLLLSTKRRDDVVDIRVRDNGTGIPGDVVEKIFNPFFTTKDTDKGTGLGLSISHDIIRQHGGHITPDSVPGEYTEMVISVPAKGGALAASA